MLEVYSKEKDKWFPVCYMDETVVRYEVTEVIATSTFHSIQTSYHNVLMEKALVRFKNKDGSTYVFVLQ